MKQWNTFALVILALFAWGCGSDKGGAGGMGGMSADTSVGAGGMGAGGMGGVDYPAGPYGVTPNETIDNLAFIDGDGQPVTFGQFHNSGKTLLLLTTTAGWCSACIDEAPVLQGIYEEFGDRGLEVMTAIFEDANYVPAGAAEAAGWRERFELTHHVVADTDFILSKYYKRDLTPMNMVVDLESMKIVRIAVGWDETATRAILEAKL